MASRIEEIRNLCRFCLCREGLMALSKATDTFSFSVDEIILCTGIQVQICKGIPYAICNGCCKMIMNWAMFRRNCLSNDIIIQKLVTVLNASMKANRNDPTPEVSSKVLGSISQHNTGTTSCEDATMSNTPVILLDDTDSDDSMPFLYGEEAAEDNMPSQSNLLEITPSPGNSGKGQPKKEREDENGPCSKLLEDNSTNDSMPSFHSEVMQHDLSDKLFTETNALKWAGADSGSNQGEKENVSNSTDLQFISTDSNDSDYSLPSIYEEAIKEALEELKEKENAGSSRDKKVESTSKYEREYVCPLCGILSRDIYNHINRTHNKIKKYACMHCQKKYQSLFQLRNHVNTWHEKRIILTCEHCGRGFTNHSSHFYHMKNSHGESDVYECETCHRKFKSIDGYRKHQKEHSITSYPCPYCDKLFKTPVTLGKHQLRYHPTEHDRSSQIQDPMLNI
uniref:Uncharacterized protein n=1 Tax=Anopheles atroparvus TaxID=41427 RepID=A0AAG5DHK7_ANOAO